MRDPDQTVTLTAVIEDDSYWQKRADEYLRLSESSKDNPQAASVFAALSSSYFGAVAERKAIEVAVAEALRAERPSKKRTRPSL
jgi:hypothetical protein